MDLHPELSESSNTPAQDNDGELAHSPPPETWRPVYGAKDRKPSTPEWIVERIKTGYHRAPSQLQKTQLDGYTVSVANHVLARTQWATERDPGLARTKLAVTWIADDLGYAKKTVRGALRKLRALRVLAFKDAPASGRRHGARTIYLRPQEEWSDALHEREVARSVPPSRCTRGEERKLKDRIQLWELARKAARQDQTDSSEIIDPEPPTPDPDEGHLQKEVERVCGDHSATEWVLDDPNVQIEDTPREIPNESVYAGEVDDSSPLFSVWLRTGLHWIVLWYLARSVEHLYRTAGVPVSDPQALLLHAANHFPRWRERLPKPSQARWGNMPKRAERCMAIGRDGVPTLRLPPSGEVRTPSKSPPTQRGLWAQLERRQKNRRPTAHHTPKDYAAIAKLHTDLDHHLNHSSAVGNDWSISQKARLQSNTDRSNDRGERRSTKSLCDSAETTRRSGHNANDQSHQDGSSS